jgi:aspartokinase/homoserine dehydrogenase 1
MAGKGAVLAVGPSWVDADHPAARLQGQEAFISFTTERYRERPLIIQGPGAGRAVTAAGLLADILRVTEQLRPYLSR